jgi:hypothetical protein
MISNAHGLAGEPRSLMAANEDFPEDVSDAHFYVHAGWDPYAAWRARVKATFCAQGEGIAQAAT